MNQAADSGGAGIGRSMHVFFIILAGQAVSILGTRLTHFALGLWVLEQTGSVIDFSLVLLFANLPGLLFSPIAGTLVDRWDRRKALILSDFGSGLCTVAIAALLFAGQLEVWNFIGILAISSLFSALQQPAYESSIPLLVPKEHLGRANGMAQLVDALAQLMAPLLAGFLLKAIAIEGVILIDLATFLVAIVTLIAVRIPRPPRSAERPERQRLWQEAAAGWSFVRSHRGLVALLAMAIAVQFALASIEVLIPPLLMSFASTAAVGTLITIFGTGLLVGSIVMSAWGGPKRRAFGFLGFVLIPALALLFAGLRADLVWIGTALFFGAAAVPIAAGCERVLWQSKTPLDLQGRVLAMRSMVGNAVNPIAFPLYGFLADRIFEPAMAPEGSLAPVFGATFGVGTGRGMGLLLCLVGTGLVILTLLAWLYRPLRRLDSELPDTVPATRESTAADDEEVAAVADAGERAVTRPAARRRSPLRRLLRFVAHALWIVPTVSILGLSVAGMTAKDPGDALTPVGLARNTSHYLEMRDQTRLAVDVWLPADLDAGQPVPTVLKGTRYGRAFETAFGMRVAYGLGQDLGLHDEVERFNEAGFAVVLVDVRGTGASTGTRRIEWSHDEIADLDEVLDWIVAQPWSDGRIGAFGVSYEGTVAELLLTLGHPALVGVAPLFSPFDPYQLAMPGGAFNRDLVETWSTANRGLDGNDLCASAGELQCRLISAFLAGIKPVTGEEEAMARIVGERANYDLLEVLQDLSFRDDAFPEAVSLADVSPNRAEAAVSPEVPLFTRVGWLDGGMVQGALARFRHWPNPQHLVIGPWNHGGEYHTDPFLPPETQTEPAQEEQAGELVDFFGDVFGGQAVEAGKSVRYYTLGEGRWKTANSWPPAGVTVQRWYFQEDHVLAPTPPVSATGEDFYSVDRTATTGDSSRWTALLGGRDVVYPDRAAEDAKLLSYTSAPLIRDTEISGTPTIHLKVASSTPDATFFVYLEDVAPDGRVTYITEGILRAVHRQTTQDPAVPCLKPESCRSFRRADALPLPVGEVAAVTFDLYATSVLIRQGHRIRLAIAGHDAAAFAPVPVGDAPNFRIARHGENASYVELPMLGRVPGGGND